MLEYNSVNYYKKYDMSISKSVADSAFMQAVMIKSQVFDIAASLPENELYQIRKRMLETVKDLDVTVIDGFSIKNRLERVRLFVNVVGRLMECMDYLDYVRKTSNYEVERVYKEIDELSNLLLVNSGTLN
jgi:hypothetical protein